MRSEKRNNIGLIEIHKSTRELFSGKILHVIKDSVLLPDGNEAERELIRHIGAVCIIPVTEDGQVFVEKQYRYAVGQILLQIPAGKLNSKEEDRLEAAKRELKEETGLTADNWSNLGLFYPAPAYSDEAITMYLAQDLHMGTQSLDEDEFLTVEKLPLDHLVEMVMNGSIPDAKTQLAILKASALIRQNNLQQ